MRLFSELFPAVIAGSLFCTNALAADGHESRTRLPVYELMDQLGKLGDEYQSLGIQVNYSLGYSGGLVASATTLASFVEGAKKVQQAGLLAKKIEEQIAQADTYAISGLQRYYHVEALLPWSVLREQVPLKLRGFDHATDLYATTYHITAVVLWEKAIARLYADTDLKLSDSGMKVASQEVLFSSAAVKGNYVTLLKSMYESAKDGFNICQTFANQLDLNRPLSLESAMVASYLARKAAAALSALEKLAPESTATNKTLHSRLLERGIAFSLRAAEENQYLSQNVQEFFPNATLSEESSAYEKTRFLIAAAWNYFQAEGLADLKGNASQAAQFKEKAVSIAKDLLEEDLSLVETHIINNDLYLRELLVYMNIEPAKVGFRFEFRGP